MPSLYFHLRHAPSPAKALHLSTRSRLTFGLGVGKTQEKVKPAAEHAFTTDTCDMTTLLQRPGLIKAYKHMLKDRDGVFMEGVLNNLLRMNL